MLCYRDFAGAAVDQPLCRLPDPHRQSDTRANGLPRTVPIMLAFLAGTIAGAMASRGVGVVCLVLPIAMLAGLTMLGSPPLRIAWDR